MNKVYGTLDDFALIKEDASRIVVSFELTPVDYDPSVEPEEEEVRHATWLEVYFYKKQVAKPTLEQVKELVFASINADTDEKILNGFVWNEKPVYLSTENQFNYKSAYDLAVQTEGHNLPIKYKLGEDENGEPVYHTFDSLASISDFYIKGVQFINSCLNEGWTRKDAIDWQPYDEILNPPTPEPEPEPEEETTPEETEEV